MIRHTILTLDIMEIWRLAAGVVAWWRGGMDHWKCAADMQT